MTKIFVRAVYERCEYVNYIRKHLPEAEVIWDVLYRNALQNFLTALHYTRDEPSIHMEDDSILTQDFLIKIEAEIAKRPNEVIQFFSMRQADIDVGSRYDNNFVMGQCFYLPANYPSQIAKFCSTWDRLDEHPTGLDLMINDFLKSRKERYWLHAPSLVDHRVCVSMIDKRRSSKRQSKTFVDPINE